MKDDLRENVRAPEKWPDGQYTTAMERQMYEMGVEATLALVEHECVERERAAFFTGWMTRGYTSYSGDAIIQDQAARRYQLPKRD